MLETIQVARRLPAAKSWRARVQLRVAGVALPEWQLRLAEVTAPERRIRVARVVELEWKLQVAGVAGPERRIRVARVGPERQGQMGRYERPEWQINHSVIPPGRLPGVPGGASTRDTESRIDVVRLVPVACTPFSDIHTARLIVNGDDSRLWNKPETLGRECR